MPKKVWCEAGIDKTEDDKTILQNESADIEAAMDDDKEPTLKTELEALDEGSS